MMSPQDVGVGLLVILGILHSGLAQINPACLNRLDLAVVFDASGSVRFNNFYNWESAKAITKSYLNSFQIGRNQVHVAIVQVSDTANVVATFNQLQDRQSVNAAIDGLQLTERTTNLADAFDVARTRVFVPQAGARENIQRVLVLVSDGQPTVRVDDTVPAANRLKTESGVLVTCVAISGDSDVAFLRRLSSSPDDPIPTFDHIYITQNFLESQELDVCILLDASGSIIFLDINNWYYAKLFLEYLTESLHVDSGRTRISCVLFNETASMKFNLDEYRSTETIINAIRNLEYSGGRTNMAAALRMAGQRVFNLNEQVSQGKKRIVLLITDGVPTDEPGQVERESVNLKRSGIDIISVVVQGKRQVNRDRLRRLASIISSAGVNLRPAVIEVTDYRALGSRVASVVDRICSVPVGRSPVNDLNVPCFTDCRDLRGRQLQVGNYHYCPFGRMNTERDCLNYIYCDRRGLRLMVQCPFGTSFDDSLKGCTWKSCSCPGNTRKCFRP